MFTCHFSQLMLRGALDTQLPNKSQLDIFIINQNAVEPCYLSAAESCFPLTSEGTNLVH